MPLETPTRERLRDGAGCGRPVQGVLGDVRKNGVEPDGNVVVIAPLDRGIRVRVRRVDVPMDDGVTDTIPACSVDVLEGLRRKGGNRCRTRNADDGTKSLIAKHGRSIEWLPGEVKARSSIGGRSQPASQYDHAGEMTHRCRTRERLREGAAPASTTGQPIDAGWRPNAT